MTNESFTLVLYINEYENFRHFFSVPFILPLVTILVKDFTKMFIQVLSLSLLASLAYGRSTGPSLCNVGNATQLANMNSRMNQTSAWAELQYNVKVNSSTIKPGETVQVTLSGSGTFKGLLLYFEGMNMTYADGWTYPVNFSTPTSCGAFGFGLGHTEASNKTTPVSFMWTSPANGTNLADNYTLKGIVVVNRNSWGVLEPVVVAINKTVCFATLLSLTCNSELFLH
jgi:hypothetical protein